MQRIYGSTLVGGITPPPLSRFRKGHGLEKPGAAQETTYRPPHAAGKRPS